MKKVLSLLLLLMIVASCTNDLDTMEGVSFNELENKSQNKDILLVTGSFYLVCAVLEMEGIDASPRN